MWGKNKREIQYAFKQSLPILFGYLFLGMAFGVVMSENGLGFLWALACSILIYAGSMQFVLAGLLSGGASIPLAAAMTLFINSRHIFYGIPFVEKFKRAKRAYPYLIFALTDETFSVLCGIKVPKNLREETVICYLSFLNHSYWILGTALGSLLGSSLPVDMTGIDFSMTALFLIIFLEQWKEAKSHLPALTGIVCAAGSLIIFGPDQFLLPALLVTVSILLFAGRKKEERTSWDK
ncbi:MAG: AzlC family ABC transporter permease [Clostridiales bacterium]|nr:AzlC family ABC transporter permease [Clostridiales bacterium]